MAITSIYSLYEDFKGIPLSSEHEEISDAKKQLLMTVIRNANNTSTKKC